MRTLLTAPTRKSRSVNKRYREYAEVSPQKDVGTSDKPQKRKLSDASLGSRWRKDELERFYGAYRKYGKDWNKVAKVVHNRTFEMVQALYNMNRAYLSLPDGIASSAGLVEMMTDHYNVQEESGSDRESNDALKVHSNPKKRRRGSVPLSGLKEDISRSPSIPLKDGCLSLSKKRSDGCTVRKRTPRVPVSFPSTQDSSGNYFSPSKRGWESYTDDNVSFTHVAALALTRASQNGGCQPISQSPYRTSHTKLSHAKSQENKSELISSEVRGNRIDARGGSTFMDDKSVGTVGVFQKGTKINGKREKIENIRINRFDDDLEACNGAGDMGEKNDGDVLNKNSVCSSFGKRKRNKKLFGGDNSEWKALQMLADLSLLMPASGIESESSMPLNKDRPDDLTDSPPDLHAGSKSRKRSKRGLSGTREKICHTFSGVVTCKSETNELGRETGDVKAFLSEEKQQAQSINKSGKKKRNSPYLKASLVNQECLFHNPNPDVPDHASFCENKPLNTGAFVEEEENLVNKVNCATQDFSPSKQSKSVGDGEYSSSNCDMIEKEPDSTVSIALSPTSGDAGLPAKRRSRCKMDPKILAIRSDIKLHEFISKEQLEEQIFRDGRVSELGNRRPRNLKDKASCCLSSNMVRTWCTYEWFYSAIDYPWFAKREFVDYLNHVGLGHIPRLTRVEWGVIKSSLGKARRFSENFLCKEREKLKQYREFVRKHYSELQTGVREGLPTDLARPLSFGQHVIAIHPKLREVYDGSVLSVDHDKCRIQFNRPELGVETVMDIDCMPSNSMNSMPEGIRTQHSTVDISLANSKGQRPGQSAVGRSVKHVPTELWGNVQEGFLRQGKVSSALLNLRQQNTCPVNSLPHWLKPPASSSGSVGCIKLLDNFSVNNQESGSRVLGIVNDSKLEAQAMVDTAIQAMSKLKEGRNALVNMREALNSSDKFKSPPDNGSSIIGSLELVNEGLDLNGHSSDPKLQHEQIPSDLITSCIASCLMIQMCAERQCPPADVAHILDSAVSSLYPRCSQNLPIYRDIEMSIRRVKTQILALVPT